MNLLQFFELDKLLAVKYGHLMLPEAFLDKVTPDIDFTDEAVVQYDVPAKKIHLQVLVTYKWSQISFDVNIKYTASEPSFMCSFKSSSAAGHTANGLPNPSRRMVKPILLYGYTKWVYPLSVMGWVSHSQCVLQLMMT